MSSWKRFITASRLLRTLGLAATALLFAAAFPGGVAQATVYDVTAFGSSELNSPWGELTVTGTFTSDFPLGGYSFTVIEGVGPYTYVFTNTTGTTLPSQTPQICGFPPCPPMPQYAVLTPSFVPTGPNTGNASFGLVDAGRMLVADGTYGPQSTPSPRPGSC